MSATYQQTEIQSHTDIMAHQDGAQCLDSAQYLQYTNKLIPSLTQTS